MREENTITCRLCGCVLSEGEVIMFDETPLCEECFENSTSLCDCCGERIWSEDSICDEEIEICQDCYDHHYTRCDRCDRLIRYDEACYIEDDDVPYCDNCITTAEDNHRPIHSYYFKPAPVFHGDGNLFMGVELEIDKGGEDNDIAREILEIANSGSENLYIKHDGSLDEGMELVTHPMTLEYHMNTMPWQNILKNVIQNGYRSHQTGTCGLHIHVNRNSLGATAVEQEDAIARILFFVENCWNELLKFSRRTQSQIDQWATRYGRKDSPKEMMDHVKKSYAGRYSAVNLMNSETIEFRLFRGTLRYNTIIATLQLVSELCNVAYFLSDDEMGSLSWTDFVSRINADRNKELIQYLKERRLFVNDLTDGEEEI